MELYAKGQLSFLILTCLKERDFYGLDIISEITNRSNGRINLKKPSVYSNLTRMEKQGYISSYLQSSDFGPNRKYYSLTENGRNFYQELKDYFDRNNIDVFKDFVDSDSPAPTQDNIINETKIEEENVETSKSDDNDFFDFSSVENETTDKNEINEEVVDDFKFIETPAVSDNSDAVFQKQELKEINNSEITLSQELAIQEDVEQDTTSVDEYNKRLYDISKDINKYKRKRSFAEDQISMTATAPLIDSQEKNKANIEEFKNSFLENKGKYNEEHRLTNLDFSRYTSPKKIISETPENKEEEIKNDAVFITKRVDKSDIERPKRIEPPKFKINAVESIKDNTLPAPKRDKSIDPSHKEILSKLYSRSKDSTDAEVREDALYDYKDLKEYYNRQNISFNEYKKATQIVEHNTSKLSILVSFITFAVAGCLSGILFLILLSVGMLNINTNFLYILLPGLLIIDLTYKIFSLEQNKRRTPSQILPQWQIWAIALLFSGLIVCLNFICGLSTSNFADYASTIILPIILILTILPFRYYINRSFIIKYWR